MKYFIFAGYGYYPNGGWGDFVGSRDNLPEAMAEALRAWEACKKEYCDDSWWMIVDAGKEEIIGCSYTLDPDYVHTAHKPEYNKPKPEKAQKGFEAWSE